MAPRKKVTFHVPVGTDARRCLDCPQMIAFVRTMKGYSMPVNVTDLTSLKPLEMAHGSDATQWFETLVAFDGESHYANCPAAARFRKANA